MKDKGSKNNWECHNIPKQIGRYADKLGLDCLATGGNCDFIVKPLGKGLSAVLRSAQGPDCPDDLKEASIVSIKLDEEWEKSVNILYKTAREGMNFMAKLTEVWDENVNLKEAK